MSHFTVEMSHVTYLVSQCVSKLLFCLLSNQKQLIESDKHKFVHVLKCTLLMRCVHSVSSCTFKDDLLEDINLQTLKTINDMVNRGYNHGKQLILTTFQRIL